MTFTTTPNSLRFHESLSLRLALDKAGLHSLPLEILIVILGNLPPSALLSLSLTCKSFYDIVTNCGWAAFVLYNPEASASNILKGSLSLSIWHDLSKVQARYVHLTSRNWRERSFIARPINNEWHGKQMPIMALNEAGSQLTVAAGCRIISYSFLPRGEGLPTRVRYSGEITFAQVAGSHQANHIHPHQVRVPDITGYAISNSPAFESAFVGFEDGTLKEISLPSSKLRSSSCSPADYRNLSAAAVIRRFEHPATLIRSVSSHNDFVVTYSANGLASLYTTCVTADTPTPQQAIDRIHHPDFRGWTSYVPPSGTFAAFGSSSNFPLLIHGVTPSGFDPVPLANLCRRRTGLKRGFAVYGITTPPNGFIGGNSGQVIISGWFDGKIRLHDLRSGARSSESSCSSTNTSQLLPVMELHDPWTIGDPKYSVSAGGPAGACVASGSALHSVVCLWDVRRPTKGWSVHAPGNDRSPIYSLILEHSRLWCANQARACVVDFGPDVGMDSYPTLTRNARSLMPKPGTSGLSYPATHYPHAHHTPKPRVERQIAMEIRPS